MRGTVTQKPLRPVPNMHNLRIERLSDIPENKQSDYSRIDQIVSIHIDAFAGFFLTKMGTKFLTLLYRSFSSYSTGILLIAHIDEQVAGFIAGTTQPVTFYKTLRKKQSLNFLAAAIPALLKSPATVIRKLIHAAFYKGDTPKVATGSALIASIAIDPKFQGIGLGKSLIKSFEFYAAKRGTTQIYLTTDACNNNSANNFYKSCGFSIEYSFEQSRGRTMHRYTKNLKTS